MKKRVSFRLVLFLAIFISMVVSLIILSLVVTSLVNGKIEKLLISEISKNSKSGQAIYGSNLNRLLKIAVTGSKQSFENILNKEDLDEILNYDGRVDFLVVVDKDGKILANYPGGIVGEQLSIN